MKNKMILASLAAAFLIAGPAWAEEGKGGEKRHHGALEKFDTDKDGAVSKAEFMKAQEARFAETDKDGNGSLSDAEFKAKHDEMRAKMKERRKAWMEKKKAEEGKAPEAAPAE